MKIVLAFSVWARYNITVIKGYQRRQAMTIYFDMDGTIADLYGVEDWLDKLKNEDASPYAEATPLLNFRKFAKLLNAVQRRGYEIVSRQIHHLLQFLRHHHPLFSQAASILFSISRSIRSMVSMLSNIIIFLSYFCSFADSAARPLSVSRYF